MQQGFVQLFLGKRKEGMTIQLLQLVLGREGVTLSLSLPLYLYPLLNKAGCLGTGEGLSFIPFLGHLRLVSIIILP